MAASNAKAGFGTLFKKGATTIAEVTDISGPGIDRDMIDVTHMESPNGAKEYVGGLTDSGIVNLELNFLPANSTQKDFLTELYAGASDTYSIVWIDGPTTWSFTALCKSFEPGASVGGKLTASASFQISGMPTFPA